MSHINLLPWRDELQKVQNKKFFAFLSGTIVVSVLLIVGGIEFLDYHLKIVELNLNFIQTSYSEVQKQIKKIQGLKKDKSDLLNRINVIQSLGVERGAAAQLLDLIPRVIPEGIYLNSLSRKKIRNVEASDQTQNYDVILNGIASDNNSISTLLKNLSNVPWISGVQLSQVKEATQNNLGGPGGFEFTIQFSQNLF